ncbi:hypothetical protein [Paraburkholderia acidiphila]|nr:hypothetical protein [Paraburkholderia acidiphila]
MHTITGEKALREVQTFVRDRLKLAHWNLSTDVAGVRKLLCDAVASGRLVPVINREYRGQPHVAQPDPAPQRWPAMGGGGSAHRPKVISYDEFLALQRANGELPPLDAPAGGVGVTLDPLPNHGAPATADDGFGLLSFVESAAGASLGSGDDDSDSDDGDAGGVSDDDPFSVDSGDGSTPLGDAQPFDYQPDMPDGNVEALAASTNKENYAARMLGYNRKTFGDMIHAMKSYNNLRGDDNVIWHDDGDVEFNGEIIDNMHNWGR